MFRALEAREYGALKLPWELASWFMETRGKRKQQELEAAEKIAPVETRARKAARIVGQTQTTETKLPSARKRKQDQLQEPETKPLGKHSRSEQKQVVAEAAGEERSLQQANKKAIALPEVKEPSKSKAESDQIAQEMDRHRRDARKELDEATRDAEQVYSYLFSDQ